MNRPPTRIAIYDMDKTVTRRPTFAPFLIHAARTRGPARLILAPFVLVTILLYALGRLDRARLKELNHRLLLGSKLSSGDGVQVARSFAAATWANNILTAAHDRIAADKADGCRLLLATASYAFYAGEIAALLGFDDVVGTGVARDADGAFLSRIDGENCYGTAKRRMVEAWLAAQGLGRDMCSIRFYSDHVSDVPMFEFADEAITVNAHAPLRALAIERGWPQLDWR
jgi:HAD superfamily hydrolase (TIGR01490 family)